MEPCIAEPPHTIQVGDAPRDAGVSGLILGEALLSGTIDYPAALEAAA